MNKLLQRDNIFGARKCSIVLFIENYFLICLYKFVFTDLGKCVQVKMIIRLELEKDEIYTGLNI